MQCKLNISFHWGTCTLSFFHFFSGEKKTREFMSNQTVHRWIFIFLITPCSSKLLWYQVPFHVSWKFSNIKFTHKGIDERVLLIKLCIEQKHSIISIYVKDTCNIILQSFESFQLQTFLFNHLMSFSNLEFLLIHI